MHTAPLACATFGAYQVLHLQGLYERVPGDELDPASAGRPTVRIPVQLHLLNLRHTEQRTVRQRVQQSVPL